MSKNNILPQLLPREMGASLLYLERVSTAEQHRRVSLACTECQKRRSKVRKTVLTFEDGPNPAQCSGTTPCTKCTKETRQCVYNPAGDRRRKAHTAKLLNHSVVLFRVAAKLRTGKPEEISQLIWEVQNLPTDQDAVNHIVDACSLDENLEIH
ncbi:hypothetical protein N7527_004796 [Penicillium freii]|nr:hypothetical protein N7527_004796 [Penicillium freii]